MLSGRGLCDELITRPDESYRLWCVVVCDLETSRMGAPYIYDTSSLRVKVSGVTCFRDDITDVVLIQLVLLMMYTGVLETCRQLE